MFSSSREVQFLKDCDRLSIDCGGPVVFSNWSDTLACAIILIACRVPGGEYVKKLVIRNTSSSLTQKVTYQTPESKYFYMPFPTPRVLNPGLSFTVEIIFRPIELV